MVSRRKTLIATSAILSSTLAGCLSDTESHLEVCYLELINEGDDPVTFYVIVEQNNDTVFWSPFRVDDGTESEGTVGHLTPNLDIETELDGPLRVRVYARGDHSELTLESERVSWTPNQTEADRPISARLTNNGKIVFSDDFYT